MIRKIAKLRRHVSKYITDTHRFPFRESIQKALGFHPARHISLDQSKAPSILVKAPSAFDVRSPRWVGCIEKCHTGWFKEINAYILDDIILSSHASMLAGKEHLLLPESVADIRGKVTSTTGSLFKLSSFDIFVARIADAKVPRGIHLGGAGASNWYHFVIECLPKAMLARALPKEYDDFPLIVPEECKTIPSFGDAVEVFRNGRRLHYLPRKNRLSVGKLIAFDDVSIGPYNLIPGEWPRVEDYSQHDDVLREFTNEFRHQFIGDRPAPSKSRRLFLARPGERRDYNQSELIAISKKYGFEPIFPEKLSLSEQAKAFSEASAIIGPSGAAWVGMIFCARPVFGLSWLPSVYEEFSSYSMLAHLLGHKLSFIEARTTKEMQTTDDVYRASYSVDLQEFETALCELTKEAFE